jgi:rhamnosyl/mannosyltransferase
MRILHVGKYFPPHKGGMETVLHELAVGCLHQGCDVRVITASDGVSPATDSFGPGNRGRVRRLPVFTHLNSQPLTLGLVSVLRREIRDFAPDLVHLHLPNPLAAWAWLTLEIVPGTDLPPLAVWYHADITRQRLGRLLLGPLLGRCLDSAAGISVSTRELADSSPLLAGRRDKVAVVPFGIDPHPWSTVDPRGGGPFLFVGRLVPYKGLAVLIDAVARTEGADLVIVGTGPQREDLENMVAGHGLAGRIRFAGELSRSDLAAEMAGARALVLPSLDRSETFGLVQLEAMAAGLPVIVTDPGTGVAGVGEVGRTCLVVPPGETVALAGALQSMIDEPSRARDMGAAGRRLFHERFDRTVMITRLMTWYEKLLRDEVPA